MKYNTILVPYDGSEGAKDAVKYAVEMVEGNEDGKIIAFSSLAGPHDIQRLMGGTNAVISYGATQDAVKHYEKAREEQVAKSMDQLQTEVGALVGDTPVEYHIEYSISPVNGILKAVENYAADAIVMGSRGESRIAGVLGSTAFGVIRGASVPVTVVK